MFVLDSSAMIDILRATDRGKRVMAKLDNPLVVSTTICMHELLRQEPHLRALFESIEVLPFDRPSAFVSSRLEYSLRKKGQLLNMADLFIASICISSGATLVTTDNDFSRVPGLKMMLIA